MKAEAVAIEGRVLEVHRGDLNRVQLDNGAVVLARRCGKLIKRGQSRRGLQVVVGDRVLVEVCPYDVTRGRIVRRL